MRTSFAIGAFGLALGIGAMGLPESHAQSPQDYRYCGFHTSSATECYFNSRTLCLGVGLGCIENPGYVGDSDARAQASARRDRQTRN
jgi:hypothetical protein